MPAARHSIDAKRFVYVATALGFLVWFLGFMVIGGEWFAMWQSQTWNGQEAAFRFYAAVLGAGIHCIWTTGPDAADLAGVTATALRPHAAL